MFVFIVLFVVLSFKIAALGSFILLFKNNLLGVELCFRFDEG